MRKASSSSSTSNAGAAPAPRITLRDIARKAGVHVTTVSMALRDHPRLPATTRRAIRRLAARLGYRPDPMLTALNAYRSAKLTPHYQATIAWLNNWPDRHELLALQQFREYFEGASARARELGYVLEEFWLHEAGISPEKLHRILRARSITTLLVAPQPTAHTSLKMNYRDFSAVAFGYSLQPSVLHVVTSHHFHAMNLIMHHLHERGYRRIGLFISADWDEKAENSCQGGLTLACWKWPELTVVPPQRTADDSELKGWLETHRPDAVISHNAIAEKLRALGYRLPRDIGFVSMNLSRDEKSLSGIYQNDELIGRTAVDLVVAMLHRGERGIPRVPIRTLIESAWVPGKTIRQLR